MQPIKLSKKEIKRHITVWIIIILSLLFIDQGGDPHTLLVTVIAFSLIFLGYMLVFYIEFLFVLPKYFETNKLKFFIFIGLTLILFEALNHFTFFYILKLDKDKGIYDEKPFYALGVHLIFLFFFVSIIAVGAYQAYVNKQKITIQNEREKSLLIKEISFFKNQFNSPTVFNFLNYCYSHLHKESKEAAEAIELFSSMLRHTIDEKLNQHVSLQQEIDYLSNYISLHRHLNKKVSANLTIDGKIMPHQIIPRILITFVENTFKHGDIYNIEHPATFKISTTESAIFFSSKNKKRKVSNNLKKSIGLGLTFVNQQLELFYKNQYDLKIDDSEEYYSCTLLIRFTSNYV